MLPYTFACIFLATDNADVELHSQPHHLSNTSTLLLSSQATRSAPENAQHSLVLLHHEIIAAAKSVILGETSEAQKDRVRDLEMADKARRREVKDKRKGKKAGRRGDGD